MRGELGSINGDVVADIGLETAHTVPNAALRADADRARVPTSLANGQVQVRRSGLQSGHGGAILLNLR